jgi:uncharacterized SAM-binding protein YcdF (DUF218 family)
MNVKKLFRYGSILILIGLCWGIYQYITITKIGDFSQPKEADVIIILGAGVWENGPSPALEARTNHAAQIYEEGYAKRFILSGGLGDHPPSEAEAMQKILLEMDVDLDQEVLFLEDQARNTVENIRYSKEIMKEQGWDTAVIVTDTFHVKRALLIAKDQNIKAFGAPAKNSVLYQNKSLRVSYTLREVAAITKYHIVRWF